VADLIRRAIQLPGDSAESLATVINSLGKGLAVDMLADPKSVPRELFDDMLAVLFEALRQMPAAGQNPQTAPAYPRRAVRKRRR
jgi:hypothetical protein